MLTRTNSTRSIILPREWLVFGMVVGCLMLLDGVARGGVVRTGLQALLQPFQRVTVGVIAMVVEPLVSLQDAVTAQRRVQELSQRYAVAVAQLEEYSELQAENVALRALLQASSSAQRRRVITAPSTGFSRPAIAAGTNQGVEVGNLVFVSGTLVGRVKTVQANQAEIVLLTNQATQPVLVKTNGGIEGLLRGDGRRILLTELPTTASITLGERVVTVGQFDIEPGLVVGEISGIEPLGAAPAQTAVVDPLVSFFQATVVEVWL